MNLLNAIKHNENFYYFENMLYSKTGIEICYMLDTNPNKKITFYESGCMYQYKMENLEFIRFYDNHGHLFLNINETRENGKGKIVVLPLKNGLFIKSFNQYNLEEFTFKSYYGKTFKSNNYSKVKNFIETYDNACDQVF